MARVCFICEKSTVSGGHRHHRPGSAGGVKGPWSYKSQRTLRKWRPNLRPLKIEMSTGSSMKIKVCMKCYKTLKNKSK